MGLGGRFGHEDDGQTPNTELTFMDYGDCQLIFEVRGLPTKDLKGAKVGNIVYGTDGYVVFTGYSSAIAYDKSDNVVAHFNGGGDHFGNWLSAIRSRKHADLHGEIEEGHQSSALCHLGNVSYRLGSLQPFSKDTNAFGDNKEGVETFGRMQDHLRTNDLKLEEMSYFLGPKLKLHHHSERFEGNSEANAYLTRAYRAPFIVPERV